MACACENKMMASELERMRRLAKALAVMEQETVVLYLNEDGTYGFCKKGEETKPIIEYISQY